MSVKLHVVILTGFLLTCAVVADRERTVRRSFTIEEEESSFISSYDSFLEDVDGNQTYSYWPDGVDPREEFGLMQKAMISDMLLQLCILSGVYVRPFKPRPKSVGNDSTPVYKKVNPQGRAQHGSQQRGSEKRANEKRSYLFDELLDLIRSKRAATSTTTEPTTAGTGPPVEDWQSDPYDVLEDAEYQFTNLCVSLFELRRLNRKLSKGQQKRSP